MLKVRAMPAITDNILENIKAISLPEYKYIAGTRVSTKITRLILPSVDVFMLNPPPKENL